MVHIEYKVLPPSRIFESIAAVNDTDQCNTFYRVGTCGLEIEKASDTGLVPTLKEYCDKLASSSSQWLANEGGAISASINGDIVGIAVYRQSSPGRHAQLLLIQVNSSCRRRGVGRSMLERVADIFRSEGESSLLVSSRPCTEAVDFFTAQGFRFVRVESERSDPLDIPLVLPLQSSRLRWCILGTSFISELMVEAIRGSVNGEVWSVAGRSIKNLTAFAERHNISVRHQDYESAIVDSVVDVVYIGLPTYMHAEWVQRCALAGKHIVCEKSFAVNMQQAEAALDVVRQSGVFCMEAQMYRCHPIVLRLLELLKEKPLGAAVSVSLVFSAPIVTLFNRIAGGSILDLGCYLVSLARILFGEPVGVSGSGTLVQPSPERLDAGDSPFDSESVATLDMPGGVTATLRACNNEDLSVCCSINCEDGVIELSNLWDNSHPDEIIVKRSCGSIYRIPVPLRKNTNFYTAQVDAVNTAVQHGRYEAYFPAMSWQDSVNNMSVLDKWRTAIGLKYNLETRIK